MVRPGIADVAARAGVSRSTVSLALNDAEARITDATRQRVKQAASDLGYSPNSVARSLRTRTTNTIGLISDQIATTPYAGRMLAGANDAAREEGYLVFLVNTEADPLLEADACRALAGQQVDAFIYARMWHQEVEVPEELPAETVLLDCRPTSGSYRAVVPDDLGGGRAAVHELVSAGHRRIAFVDTDDVNRPLAADLRHRAYRDVLAESGLKIDERLHVAQETSSRGGRLATARLLDLSDDIRPTAIFYFNDRMAVGGYAEAHARRLEIPRDLSVFGFDDQQLVAAELDPPLSTIALPHYEMGRWAMEVALGRRDVAAETHHMPCPVIRRASVGPPPDQIAKPGRRRPIQ